MQAEIIALRHQLTVLQRSQKPKRLVLNRCDRCLWRIHFGAHLGFTLSSWSWALRFRRLQLPSLTPPSLFG